MNQASSCVAQASQAAAISSSSSRVAVPAATSWSASAVRAVRSAQVVAHS